MPVAVADRTSAELSAAQQVGVVADRNPWQGGCVRLPHFLMMLTNGTGRRISHTSGLMRAQYISQQCCGTCSACHDSAVAPAQLVTTRLWRVLSCTTGTCLQRSASRQLPLIRFTGSPQGPCSRCMPNNFHLQLRLGCRSHLGAGQSGKARSAAGGHPGSAPAQLHQLLTRGAFRHTAGVMCSAVSECCS